MSEFKSLIIVIAGFQNFVCCLVWAVYLGVQITDEGRSLYIGSTGNRPLGRPRRRWEGNIRIDVEEVGIDKRNCFDSAKDRNYLGALVDSVMNSGFHKR